MKVFHMQPPAAAAAAIYARNRDLFPAGSGGYSTHSQSSLSSGARSFGMLTDASSMSQLGVAALGVAGALAFAGSHSNLPTNPSGPASSGTALSVSNLNAAARRGHVSTPDTLTSALLAASSLHNNATQSRPSHKVFWWENALSASPYAHIPAGAANTGVWGGNVGINAALPTAAQAGTSDETDSNTASAAAGTGSSTIPPASTALAALVTTEGGAPVARLAQKVAPPSARLAAICRKVVLAPTYGGPPTCLFRLPISPSLSKRLCSGSAVSPYMVYACAEKVIGLLRLPLTGSPTQSIALIAHPGPISQVRATPDGRFVITAGGPDRCLNLWATNPAALDATLTLSGKGASPFLSLLEGGENGPVHTSIQEFFYSAQLRAQGLHVTQPRAITGYVPISEAPNIMRALGHFPSEQQVCEMSHEIFWDYHAASLAPPSTGKNALVASSGIRSSPNQEPSIDLNTFIALFVNHRPVKSFDKVQIEQAFATIIQYLNNAAAKEAEGQGSSTKLPLHGVSGDKIDVHTFVELMTNFGEKMSEAELKVLLATLVGTEAIPSMSAAYQTKLQSEDTAANSTTAAATSSAATGPKGFNLNSRSTGGSSSTAAQISSLKYRRRPRLHAEAVKVPVQTLLPTKLGVDEFTHDVLGLASAASLELAQASGYEGEVWRD